MVHPTAARTANVYIYPADERMTAAVEAGGGVVVASENANVFVINWTEGRYDEVQRQLHPGVEWVALGFAGVDGIINLGLIDEQRLWTAAQGAFAQPVAEYVLASVLALIREFPQYARAGRWTWERGRMLSDTTVGVVGTGGIGTRCITLLSSLGADVVAVSRTGRHVMDTLWTRPVDELQELLAVSDVVVLATPLTRRTRGLIGRKELACMVPGAALVNVARGAVVDTDALVVALEDGRLGGAVLDVTDPEPLPDDHPLWRFENVLITSHTACTTEMSLQLLGERLTENMVRFRHGEPLAGIVDLARGY